MTDFNSFDNFNSYDTSWTDLSNSVYDLSLQQWDTSMDLSQVANNYWVDGNYDMYHEFYNLAEAAEWSSNALYDASWDAYYGPINSEGYTAYDASMGYTSTDTSFIEPASAAGSTSMISDYNATSTL